MLSAFFSEYVESVALFIKYVSPELVIFIGGICTVSRFVNGRLLCRFLFSLAALSLEHCFARPFRSPAQAELKSIYVYRVHIMIRIMGVKRIFIWIRRCRYAIEEIFTSANMIITEFDK